MPSQSQPTEDLSVTPRLDADAIPTLIVSRPGGSSSPRNRHGTVSVVGSDAPRLSHETDTLRRKRLQAATLFFLATITLFFVWRLFFSNDHHLWPLNLAVLVALASVFSLLSNRQSIPPRTMLALEFTMFGVLAGFMALRQYDAMRTAFLTQSTGAGMTGSAHVLPVRVAVKDALIIASIVSFAYGMLIPNSWKRAAAVVLTLMMVPVATQIVLFKIHPGSWPLAMEVATLAGFSENLLYVTVVSGLAIYGTHVINTLRVEAFQARQLNQYKLGERLGSGGMGEVFQAEHRMLKRPCAIKLITPSRAADSVALARFEREVRATARLSHPNTVEIYDYGQTDEGLFYYVMELLQGLNLAEIVERFGPMPAGRVVYLLRPTCEALSEAHAAGMIHRDLKPANLFAAFRGGRHDVAKILDFGLVKGGDDPGAPLLSREGTIRGTPHFMAPEQATAEPDLDARCDLYAIGAVAYYLLTATPPFDGDSAARVMIGHAHDPVEPPSLRTPDVPPDLEAVVLRCLAKRREDRFPTAESLASAFSACACASDWDSRLAAQWWRVVDPTIG